jgi:hypothetical protein
MPIKGVSSKRQIPRLGKIRLGELVPTKDGKNNRPMVVDHFKVPAEVAAVYGENPTVLTDVYLPSEDRDVVFPQFLKRYTYNALVCKGDGEHAFSTVVETGESVEVPCDPYQCQYYQAKQCHMLASLVFLLPKVPGLGVWQMDTTSYYTIVSINNSLDIIRNLMGRISNIPLELRRVKKTIMTREGGKPLKRDIWTVELNTADRLVDLARAPQFPFALGADAAIEGPADTDEGDPLLTSAAEAEEEHLETKQEPVDRMTGAVKGPVLATPAQLNSLKVIIA